MPIVERLEAVVKALRDKAASLLPEGGSSHPSVIVGYTSAYAVYVHEDLTKQHPVGQAKFLEQPARQEEPNLARMIRSDLAKGRNLPQSLIRAGLYLQGKSQRLVPVDTGALRASAFTKLDKS